MSVAAPRERGGARRNEVQCGVVCFHSVSCCMRAVSRFVVALSCGVGWKYRCRESEIVRKRYPSIHPHPIFFRQIVLAGTARGLRLSLNGFELPSLIFGSSENGSWRVGLRGLEIGRASCRERVF